MINLDLLSAETAQTIVRECTTTHHLAANDVENLVTKALGVVQENGIYAGLLYLYSRGSADKDVAERVRICLLREVERLGCGQVNGLDAATALAFLTDHVCEHLDTLLLVKQVWEQTLIYARYGAKAAG